ncbi:MAG: DUF4493 domain-containing protein [Parabacteroides sp.]|nr:DUF4493 domain-containing protein [Parabacteroides sp.]
MKYITYIITSIFLFASCQKEDLTGLSENSGYLSLESMTCLSADVETVSTRAVDEDLYVKIKGKDIETTYSPGKIQGKIELDAGDYELEVYNEAYNEQGSWSKEYKGDAVYYKKTSFKIESGKVNYLKVEVPMINVGVLLSLPDDFETYFPTSTFTVTDNNNANSRVVVIKNGEKAYFSAVSSLSYNLQVTNIDEEELSSKGKIPKEGEIKSGTIYEINYDHKTKTLRVIE